MTTQLELFDMDQFAKTNEDIKADVELEKQARKALASEMQIAHTNIDTLNKMIQECQKVVAGIEIDGPKACEALAEQEVRIEKLARQNTSASYLNSNIRKWGLESMQTYQRALILTSTLISLSALAIALKLWQ